MTTPTTPPSGPDEALIEAAATAFRERGRDGGVRTHPAWHDLDDEGRLRAFEAARANRVLEAALDSEGLSSTAKAVLARIRAR